jgi:hypothetical protein
MTTARRRKRLAATIPVAYPVGSPEGQQQLEDGKRRQIIKSLIGYFYHEKNIHLRALCRFAGITAEVTETLKQIDEKLRLAEKKRFLEPVYSEDVLESLCKVLAEVNKYANNNLGISTHFVLNRLSKKELTGEEQSLKLTFKSLVKEVKAANKVLEKNMERAKGRSLLESIGNSIKFLFRNLILGTVLVSLTTLAHPLRGIAYLVSCFSPRWKPDTYHHSVLKAWGNKSKLMRWELEQANLKFVKTFKLGMFKWINGNAKPAANAKPRVKSELEQNNHVDDKKRFVAEAKIKKM